jgi:radical SAM superfamily enzyme YgiQ (UPF0313 family)
MFDVVFVRPPNPLELNPSKRQGITRCPLNLALLSSYIRTNSKLTCTIVDFEITDAINARYMAETILSNNPKYVCFTTLTPRFPTVVRTIEWIYNLKPKVINIIGGPHVTGSPYNSINYKGISYAITGEGEEALLELLLALEENKDVSNIKNLLYKKDNMIKTNEQRPFIKNLDSLPLPAWDLMDISKYLDPQCFNGPHMAVFTSRGCPYSCLRGDTIIHTIDGDFPIKELIGKDIKVLTRDPITQEPIYAQSSNIGIYGKNKKLLRIHFNDGTHIDCTPDHKFMVFKAKNQYTKEREWEVEAKDLKPKQSVRAVRFETTAQGYINLSTRRNINRKRSHIVIESVENCKILNDEQVHHIDRNKSNDTPSNLLRVKREKHISIYHPEVSKRMKINNPIWNKTHEQRVKHSKLITTGKKRSPESKERYRLSKLGQKNPNFGKHSWNYKGLKNQGNEVNHKIDFIEYLKEKEDVYCMSVPGYDWFYANKVLVHNCKFCASAVTWNHKVRFRSPDSVLKELSYIVNNLGINNIMFHDDSFAANRKRAIEICSKIIDAKLNINYTVQIRADNINNELLDVLKRSGCKFIAIGVESGNEKILKSLGKKETKEQIINAIKLIKKYNIKSVASYVIGFPEDTHETIKETIDFAEQLKADQSKFMILSAYPGTYYYTHAKILGLINEYSFDQMEETTFYDHVSINLSQVSSKDLLKYQDEAYMRLEGSN